eukprot:gene16674-32824_t
MTDVVDIFVPGQGFAPAPIKLSVGREYTNTVALSPNTLAVAGGWNKKGGESVIDVFLSLNEQGASTGESGSRSGSQMETKTQKQHEGKRSGGSHTPGVGSGVGSVDGGVGASRLPDKTLHMGSAGYDVGAASIEVTATATTQASSSSSTTTLTYIVDNEQLLVVDGTGNLLATIPLPEALSGPGGTETSGGTIPAAHVAQNGASIPSMNLVCFYSLKVSGRDSVKNGEQHSAAMCYHTVQQRWHAFDCTVPHDGGQVVAMGPLLLVAGGFDPTSSNSTTTAVVDVFTFAAESP